MCTDWPAMCSATAMPSSGRLVSEHRTVHRVTNRVDTVDRGPAPRIHLDAPALIDAHPDRLCVSDRR